MARGSAQERARRLLALLGTFARDSSASLEELARMTGVTVDEIADDLELLSLCGVAPYGPEDLIPVFVEDGMVHVFGRLPALERRVRLSPAEARALAAALEIAGRSPSDPLVERLFAAAAEVDPAELRRFVHAATTGGSAAATTLASCAVRRECVRLHYQSAGSEQAVERVIEPLGLFNERGAWYAEAFCRSAGEMRTFRLDRILSAEPTGETFTPREHEHAGTAIPAGALPSARVHFEPGTPLPEREWPGLRVVSEDASGTLVEVPFAGTAWIAREIVSFLGAARVIGPAEVRAAVSTLAARKLESVRSRG